MKDFLGELLEGALELDHTIHQGIHLLRQRIYALKLAEDEEFVGQHRAFSEQLLKTDEASDGLTAEEFAERYLSQHTD